MASGSPYVDLPSGPAPSAQGQAGAGYPQVQNPYASQQGSSSSGAPQQALGVPAPPESQPNSNRIPPQAGQVPPQQQAYQPQQPQEYQQQQMQQSGVAGVPPQGPMPGAAPGGPYVQSDPAQAKPRMLDNVAAEVNKAGKQAEKFAKNLWGHMSPGPSHQPSLSALAKTALGKVQTLHHTLSPQAAERYWRDSFHPPASEQFVNFFSCHLSTTTGPIVGTLFVSNAALTFISDRPVGYIGTDGKHMSTDYKVNLPMNRIECVSSQHHSENPDEKYVQVITVDGHHFWFMAFLAYDQAFDTITKAAAKHMSRMRG